MKKLTREERRRRSQRWLHLFLLLLLAWLGSYLILTVEAELPAMYKPEPATQDGSLPGDDTPALVRCYLTGEEQEAAENELIEAALLSHAVRLDDVTMTPYCTCSRCAASPTASPPAAEGPRPASPWPWTRPSSHWVLMSWWTTETENSTITGRTIPEAP